ncbi:hypothetical protein N7478_002733 [Penicillium angulare]|uniref:uncharacterized protein n=1 Tax=Penicillium angulare TaxID=116970 RepID=UPI002542655B|nr:uncharacterized protein N7478_002733 [Penicillium angulare]KAJ5287047.1 hypothetical protein N7478_002733 [Penicillium angulare]
MDPSGYGYGSKVKKEAKPDCRVDGVYSELWGRNDRKKRKEDDDDADSQTVKKRRSSQSGQILLSTSKIK